MEGDEGGGAIMAEVEARRRRCICWGPKALGGSRVEWIKMGEKEKKRELRGAKKGRKREKIRIL